MSTENNHKKLKFLALVFLFKTNNKVDVKLVFLRETFVSKRGISSNNQVNARCNFFPFHAQNVLDPKRHFHKVIFVKLLEKNTAK